MESKVGSILALISAILGFIGAVILLIIGLLAVFVGSRVGTAAGTAVSTGIGIFYIVFAIIVGVIAFLTLKASKWMKDPGTTKKGGITALICGIIGVNILTLIAAIFGLVDAGK